MPPACRGFFRSCRASSCPWLPGWRRAAGNPLYRHRSLVARDLGVLALRHPEVHRGIVDPRLDRCGHLDIVPRNVAEKRHEQTVGLFKVVTPACRLEEYARGQGFHLGDAGRGRWKCLFGGHGRCDQQNAEQETTGEEGMGVTSPGAIGGGGCGGGEGTTVPSGKTLMNAAARWVESRSEFPLE